MALFTFSTPHDFHPSLPSNLRPSASSKDIADPSPQWMRHTLSFHHDISKPDIELKYRAVQSKTLNEDECKVLMEICSTLTPQSVPPFKRVY